MRRCCPRLAVLAALGCAQYGAPPGGERDQVPPQVVATIPEPFAVVPDLRGPVVIRFDERLSEQGAEDAILVSPRTGDVEVERDGNALRVEVEGGWRPGQVYRVVILPELRDLFGNQRREAGELVFSTGPPIPSTALAGLVTDRITGEPPQNAVVHAVRPDSSVYVAPAATDGFYALLNLPNGAFDLIGFTDANGNWRLDPNEPRSVTHAVALSDDTVAVNLAILPVDSTPAIVAGARQDGVAIRVQLDDYVDAAGLEGAVAQLLSPDSAPLPIATDVLTPAEYERMMPSDTTSVVEPAPPDTTPPAEPAPPAQDTVRADTARAEPLPARELIVLPATPLVAGSYQIAVQGVTNINGIPGGGGRTPVTIVPPAPPPTDTMAVPADTAAAPASPPPR